MVVWYDFRGHWEVICQDHGNVNIYKKCTWKCSHIDLTYSWNTQLAHATIPKTASTTAVRFIGFVAKISVIWLKFQQMASELIQGVYFPTGQHLLIHSSSENKE